MGGKRPDQHNIAPGEAGATDYKHYPNEPGDLDAHKHKPRAKELPWSDQHRPKTDRDDATADNSDDTADASTDDNE